MCNHLIINRLAKFKWLLDLTILRNIIQLVSFQVQGTPGVTGSVMWDSGVILGKFLEHSVELGTISLQEKKVIELGSGCGLVG